jgi:PmbA protein
VGQYRSHSQYANSHGFAADRTATRYSRVCPVLVRDGQRKHRDHDFSVARSYEDLTPPAELVASAANKAIMRCGAKTLTSREASVIFDPSTAKCIWSTVLGALAGSRIYQKASFLKDAQGQRVMPEHLSLIDDPWRLRGLGSANFDAEGVATRQQGFIESGVLQRFITSSYSARKLGTVTSATAGGVHNLTVLGGTGHLKEMLQSMGDGLLVTELMGSGIDVTTGQLSLGVFGYWIAGGQITHPVEGMTLAGDLSAMLLNIHRVGADIDYRSTLNCGSLWINKVALAVH